MFEKGEHAVCPTCGVALEDFARLGKSLDAEELDEGQEPEEPKVPFLSWGLGRGPLLLALVIGLGAFFLPWIHLEFPWAETRSALDLSRGRLGWMWGTGCAWFVAIPVVLSRRAPTRMRTARVPIASLVGVPLIALAVLFLFPPTSVAGIKVRFHYGVGVWTTCVVALVALVFAARFGVESRTAKVVKPPRSRSPKPKTQSTPPSTLH